MEYNVRMTPDCNYQLQNAIAYLVYEKKNLQAAQAVYNDAMDTLSVLAYAAGSLEYCKYPRLKRNGYRAIKLSKHNYVFIYTINEKEVSVEGFVHTLQEFQ